MESWISRQKVVTFLRFSVFHGQIMVWILKLSRKTANSPSKLQIVVFKSWLNFCAGYFPALRFWSTLDRLIVLGKILLTDQTVMGANIAIRMKRMWKQIDTYITSILYIHAKYTWLCFHIFCLLYIWALIHMYLIQKMNWEWTRYGDQMYL